MIERQSINISRRTYLRFHANLQRLLQIMKPYFIYTCSYVYYIMFPYIRLPILLYIINYYVISQTSTAKYIYLVKRVKRARNYLFKLYQFRSCIRYKRDIGAEELCLSDNYRLLIRTLSPRMTYQYVMEVDKPDESITVDVVPRKRILKIFQNKI